MTQRLKFYENPQPSGSATSNALSSSSRIMTRRCEPQHCVPTLSQSPTAQANSRVIVPNLVICRVAKSHRPKPNNHMRARLRVELPNLVTPFCAESHCRTLGQSPSLRHKNPRSNLSFLTLVTPLAAKVCRTTTPKTHGHQGFRGGNPKIPG